MKKIALAATAASLFLFSCNSESGTGQAINDSTTTVGEKMEAVGDTLGNQMKSAMSNENYDQDFIKDVAEANQKELNLLKAGLASGTDKEIKSGAKMMIADHEKMGKEVMAYAAAHNIALPAMDNATPDMGETPGAKWDAKYADMLEDDHEKTVNKFEDGSSKAKDAELKSMIDKTLPTLRHHLEMAKSLDDRLN